MKKVYTKPVLKKLTEGRVAMPPPPPPASLPG
jgi:hypothetical protein